MLGQMLVLLSLLPGILQVLATQEDEELPSYPPLRKRCTVYDRCWPSDSEWSAFNSSISGRLFASRPSAAVCHDPDYDAELCEEAKANWTSGDWRVDQVGGYSAILWELAEDECFPRTPRKQPCQQGLVAPMTVNATTIEYIQTAICFASKHDLYLTVKNTGHDHLGRSSGDGSFAIWTHNMKGRTWHDSFTPKNAPMDVQGVTAVTLQPGEEWLDVYKDAHKHGVIVAGGSARTVGAIGGYLTGGCHSPFSFHYGLAADNLLEVRLVTPCGTHVVLNEYTDPEYFWAVRGGGGNAWGIITSATYRTHPQPSHIQVALFQANMSTPEAYRRVYTQALKSIPAMTDAGYTGYGSTDPASTVQFIFLQPNGTDAALEQGFPGFMEIFSLDGTDSISAVAANLTFPSWKEYADFFLTDPNIATNAQDASRLLTVDVLMEKTKQLADLALRYPGMAAGHNFSKSKKDAQAAFKSTF